MWPANGRMTNDKEAAALATPVVRSSRGDPKVDHVLPRRGAAGMVGNSRFEFVGGLDGHDRIAPGIRSDHAVKVLEGQRQ